MESNMVNDLFIKQINTFFRTKHKDYHKQREVCGMPYGPFFEVAYSNMDILITITGEYGFNVDITMFNSNYNLSQYDRSVLEHTSKTTENLTYLLSILDKFLK